MKFSISIYADGDREISLEEVVELADAVAIYSGIATGAGTMGYGAQIIVDSPNSMLAVNQGLELFAQAVEKAKLPLWPITKAESMSEDQDWEDGYE